VWLVTLAVSLPVLAQLALPLRIAALSLLAYAARVALLSGSRRLLMSPPLHMAGLLTLFYSFIPLLSNWVIGDPIRANSAAIIATYPGSAAEGLILGLACLCTAAHFALWVLIRRRSENHDADIFSLVYGWISLAALAAIAVAGMLTFRTFDAEWMLNVPISREVWFAVPAVVAFCGASVVYAWSRGPRDAFGIGLVCIAAALGVLLLWNQAPMPVLIAYALALLYAVRTNVSLNQLARASLVAAILAPAIIIAVFFVLRPSYSGLERDLVGREIVSGAVGAVQRVLVVAEAKLLQRQAISAGCYGRIAERSLSGKQSGNPFYFATALVPRILWPDKPSLSRGSEYAELCGISGAAAARHSESITIIGEPILVDGLRGLVVAELTLVALLAAAAYVGLTGGPVRMICLTALLPWLLAVEQHFAMYVGNVFKMALVILPLALGVHWTMRRRSRNRLEIPEGSTGPGARLPAVMGDGLVR
jgi:nitrate reductase gamma subunit